MIRFVVLIAALLGSPDRAPSAESVYRTLKSLPAPATDDPITRPARLRDIAAVIASVSRSRHEAAVLISLGYEESRFAEFVGRGCVLIPATVRANCDRGRARSYWQLWQPACPAGWAYQRGDPASVREFAICALRHFAFAASTCADRVNLGHIAGGFAGYRTTTYCDWPPSAKRAVNYRRVLGDL